MEESCRLQNLLPTPSCGIKNREATSTSLLWSNYLGSLQGEGFINLRMYLLFLAQRFFRALGKGFVEIAQIGEGCGFYGIELERVFVE